MRRRALCLALLACALLAPPVLADSFQEARVRSGMRIFRPFLRADLAIKGKLAADGSLLVLVVGTDGQQARTAELSRELQEGIGAIGGAMVKVKPTSVSSLGSLSGTVAAVFVAEPLSDDQLRTVVKFGIDRHAISFSAIEGDVERGVLCGVSYEAKVVHFINARTMKASDVTLSPMAMKLGKIHE